MAGKGQSKQPAGQREITYYNGSSPDLDETVRWHRRQVEQMKKSSRSIWEQPWGYREGFIVAAGIVFSGLLLQFTVANIQPALFASPLSGIFGVLFVTGLLVVHFLLPRNSTVRWLSGAYAAVPAIAILLLLCIILGLIPQFPHDTGDEQLPPTLFTALGWYRMTTSWPFVLLCFYILFILGLTILKRTGQKQSFRDIGFYLNHLGLFLALLGGLLGSADLERLTMHVSEGEIEWRAKNNSGDIKELTLAIQLDTFLIEEYPPRLVLVENETERILPAVRPESYQFEAVGKTARFAGVTVEIVDYLPHAALFKDSTFLNVVPMMMEGATTAIKVRVNETAGNQPVEGWVSNGSYLFPQSTLQVSENTSIAMPPQEVKRYSSYITLYTEKGTARQAIIEVNRPLQVEDWMIYQYSYDDEKGKYSDTSVFELVRDPWLKVVYTGIYMLMAGALFLFIAGPKKGPQEKKFFSARKKQTKLLIEKSKFTDSQSNSI